MRNSLHQEIIDSIKKVAPIKSPDREGFGLKYVGTNKPSYHLDTKTTRQIAQDFVKSHQLTSKEFIEFLNSLYYGETYDEVNIAAKIIEFSPALRQNITPKELHYWLNNTQGWAEVDTLCQMAFTAEDLFSHWAIWEKAIQKFAMDPNAHIKRASLVLLTKPLRHSTDLRLPKLAIHNLDILKNEKDILITKAVSWVMRAIIKNHRGLVAEYLEENLDCLPKIAIREVSTKLTTGKKYVNKKLLIKKIKND